MDKDGNIYLKKKYLYYGTIILTEDWSTSEYIFLAS